MSQDRLKLIQNENAHLRKMQKRENRKRPRSDEIITLDDDDEGDEGTNTSEKPTNKTNPVRFIDFLFDNFF